MFSSITFGDDDGYDGVTVGMSKCQLGCEGVALSDRPVPPTGQLACLLGDMNDVWNVNG